MTYAMKALSLLAAATLSLSLAACGPDGETKDAGKPAAKSAKASGPTFDMRKTAAFSDAGNCAAPNVIIKSYPNMYIKQDAQMCDLATGSKAPPVWTWQTAGACTQNGIISQTDADETLTLTWQSADQYVLSQTGGAPDKTLTLCDADLQNAPVMWGATTEPDDRNDFDFKQSYNKYCEDAGCYSIPRHQKYSDYSAGVLSDLNLSTNLKSHKVLAHLTDNYAGRVKKNTFNNRKHATDNIFTVHLMPEGNPALNEYVIYVRVNGDGAFDKIKDWGGRVKCAPAKTGDPFQNTPCP